MRTVVVLAAGALALAACGQKSGGGAAEPQVSGAGASAAKLPADLPAWAAPMPGGKLDTVVVIADGGLFTFFTDAGPEAVQAHYAQAATAAGMKNVTASGADDVTWSAKPPGADSSKRLTVKAVPEDGRTRVDIAYHPGAA